MAQVIAIATADWHLHKFQAFDNENSRLFRAMEAAKEIIDTANKLDVPILFAGDLIHSPKNIENQVNSEVQDLFTNHLKVQFYCISGNHDLSERNTRSKSSPSHLDALKMPFVKRLNENTYCTHYYDNGYLWINGIDYMNNSIDTKHAIMDLPVTKEDINHIKILLLHSDMPGSLTSDGFLVNQVEHIPTDLDKFFYNWDLVLCGHIHRPQRLSNKVLMLGCPIQQNQGDMGQDLGYWKIYSNKTVEFVHLSNYPKFIKLGKGEKPYNTKDYFIKYNDVLVDAEVQTGEFAINNSKAKLATRYCALRSIKSKTKRRALINILNDD